MKVSIQNSQFTCQDIQAVLFDLDGTLVESTGLISDILSQWASAQGLDVQSVLNYSHGKRTIDIVQHYIKDERITEHYYALTQRFLEAAVYTQSIPYAAEFIHQIEQHKIPWMVVSSSERILIEARMVAAQLPLAKQVIAAEDIQYGKPDPEGYLKAAQMLNIPIQSCLIFEDSPSGIKAAQSAQAQLIIIGQAETAENVALDFSKLLLVS